MNLNKEFGRIILKSGLAVLLLLLAMPAIAMPAGQLSLTAGNSAPEADMVGTSVYLVPVDGNTAKLWDGSDWTVRTYAGQLSLALGSTAVGNYDLFNYWDGSAVQLCQGPAWASNTSRGTGAGTTEVALVDGRLVNANSISCKNGASTWTVPAHYGLLRGGFRVYTTGYTADTAEQRFLWDLYRPRLLPVKRRDNSASWTYGTATFRQANGSTGNRVTTFNGVAGRPVSLTVTGYMDNSTATARPGYVGIGVDSTTYDSSAVSVPCAAPNGFPDIPCSANYSGFPGMGYHEFNWLERGAGADTQTWYSTGSVFHTGMIGSVLQ